jgi:hypothetical protein
MRDEPVPQIIVTRQSEARYRVKVKEDISWTAHAVTVTSEDMARYAPSGTTPDKLLEVSFEFLLEHEPKEAILTHFHLPLIEEYYPEYSSRVREKLE